MSQWRNNYFQEGHNYVAIIQVGGRHDCVNVHISAKNFGEAINQSVQQSQKHGGKVIGVDWIGHKRPK